MSKIGAKNYQVPASVQEQPATIQDSKSISESSPKSIHLSKDSVETVVARKASPQERTAKLTEHKLTEFVTKSTIEKGRTDVEKEKQQLENELENVQKEFVNMVKQANNAEAIAEVVSGGKEKIVGTVINAAISGAKDMLK